MKEIIQDSHYKPRPAAETAGYLASRNAPMSVESDTDCVTRLLRVREAGGPSVTLVEIQAEHLNEMARTDPEKLIADSEKNYHDQLIAVAESVKNNGERNKIVMLAGPSASGKTTTAHKIAHFLADMGCETRVISLDDFYHDKTDNIPKCADGSPDYESIYALDLDLIEKCLGNLIASGKAWFPRYCFTRKTRLDDAEEVYFPNNGAIIIEGIHALNPILKKNLDDGGVLKVYVSVRTIFMSGDETLLTPEEVRLIRRMARDKNFRGANPEITIGMWKAVIDGEREYIAPYRDSADIRINTTIDYEPFIFRKYLLPLLEEVDADNAFNPKLLMIRKRLEAFEYIDELLMPGDTLLREFIK